MTEFTPVAALLGGSLIGLSAVLLLLLNGRIAGISGILGGFLRPRKDVFDWRIAFLAGLIAVPVIEQMMGNAMPEPSLPGWPTVIAGGLLVGFGSRLAGGCTSGHGVCGIARLSPRSIVGTVVFMATAIVVVFVMRHVIGG